MKKLATLLLLASLTVACGDDAEESDNNVGANNSAATNNANNTTGTTGSNNDTAGTNNANNTTGTTGSNNTTGTTGSNNTTGTTGPSYVPDTDGCAAADPGSDIYGVALESEAGEVLGWARSIDFLQGEAPSGNDFTDHIAVLDGNDPELDLSMCPVPGFTAETAVALGCGGQIALQFVDAQAAPLMIDDTMQITVYEYGAICAEDPTNAIDNSYELYACDADPVGTEFEDCWIPLGDLGNTGITTISTSTLEGPAEFITILDSTM